MFTLQKRDRRTSCCCTLQTLWYAYRMVCHVFCSASVLSDAMTVNFRPHQPGSYWRTAARGAVQHLLHADSQACMRLKLMQIHGWMDGPAGDTCAQLLCTIIEISQNLLSCLQWISFVSCAVKTCNACVFLDMLCRSCGYPGAVVMNCLSLATHVLLGE